MESNVIIPIIFKLEIFRQKYGRIKNWLQISSYHAIINKNDMFKTKKRV